MNQHVLLIMVNILITLVLIVNQRDYSNTLIKILVLLMAHYQKVLMNLFQSLVFLIAVIVHVKLARKEKILKIIVIFAKITIIKLSKQAIV